MIISLRTDNGITCDQGSALGEGFPFLYQPKGATKMIYSIMSNPLYDLSMTYIQAIRGILQEYSLQLPFIEDFIG